MEVRFYDTVEDTLLNFAVIIARSEGKLVFCKHRKRETWELPGGHREKGETIEQTARRELMEETGASQFTLQPICVYSVIGKTRVNESGQECFGGLFFAEITAFAPELHSEMERIELMDTPPGEWTYPLIQPKLLQEARRRGIL